MRAHQDPGARFRSDRIGCLVFDKALIDKIRRLKEERGYTLHDLSKMTDIQVSTLERWLKTNRINKLYAKIVKERLKIE